MADAFAAIEIGAHTREASTGKTQAGTDWRGLRVMLDDVHQNDFAPLGISITTTAYAVWVAISGELDSSNHDQLKQALAGLCLAGVGHVHLQLSDLRFCDVAGMRQLLSFTRETGLRGRRVSTHGTSRDLRRLCHLMTDGKVSLDRPVWERARRDSSGIKPLPVAGNALTP